jgi:pyruvate formate lyase activating enzyme
MEFLSFHQLGRANWEATGESYLLENTLAPSHELVARVKGQFEAHGLDVTVA